MFPRRKVFFFLSLLFVPTKFSEWFFISFDKIFSYWNINIDNIEQTFSKETIKNI